MSGPAPHGHGAPGQPHAAEALPHARGAADGADEPPPVLGRWGVLYALVLLELVLVILFCGWLTRLSA